MKESLDLALRVHPDTRHVFVVCGASPTDAWYENEFRSQVPDAAARRGVHLLARTLRAGADRPAGGAAGALDCLSGLRSVPMVRAGEFRTASVIERLAAASNAPIYTWNGNVPGVFGGRLLSTELVAERTSRTRAARVARRATRGHSDHHDRRECRCARLASARSLERQRSQRPSGRGAQVSRTRAVRAVPRLHSRYPRLGAAPDVADRGTADPAEKPAACRALAA